MATCNPTENDYQFHTRRAPNPNYTDGFPSHNRRPKGSPSIPIGEPDWDCPNGSPGADDIEVRFNQILRTMSEDKRRSDRLRRQEALKYMLQLREEAIAEGMPLRSEDEINREVARRRGIEE